MATAKFASVAQGTLADVGSAWTAEPPAWGRLPAIIADKIVRVHLLFIMKLL